MRIVSLPGVWKHRLVTAAGPLALAAAMIVYFIVQSGPSAPPLPAYTVTALTDPAAPPAGPAAARLRLPAGARSSRFEIELRPESAPEGKVVAYAFTLDAPDAEPAPLDAKVELAPEGMVRLSGSARALEGAREIRVVLGEPASIGKFVDAAARAASRTTDAAVRVLAIPIDRD
ncbi:MAG: hypothetical protein KF850_07640 [Labilithrix sp.]|nr:hypothetical protein [Labilithrix sp.]